MENSLPIWAMLGLMLTGACVGLLITSQSDADTGLAGTFAFAAIIAVAYSKRSLRRTWFYCAALAVFIALHVAALARWHPRMPRPAIVSAPLVFIDIILMLCIMRGLDKAFGRKS